MKLKVVLTLILVVALCIPFLTFGTSISAENDAYKTSLIYDEFSADKIAENSINKETWYNLESYKNQWSGFYSLETPELFMLDCKLTAYYRNRDAEKPTGAIIYAVGHGAERIGTESDLTIIEDFLNDGYIVIVTDFLNNPAAVSPAIDGAISALGYEIRICKNFVGDFYHEDLKAYTFFVPAGYRLERDVPFFDVLESGAKGVIETTIDAWNHDNTKAVVEGMGIAWTKADSLDDMIVPNGKPINDVDSGNYDNFFVYKMDIVYPSMPAEGVEVPVLAHGASGSPRSIFSELVQRISPFGFLMRGYAYVIYEHEYKPYMITNEGYGQIDGAGYTLTPYLAAKFHSAAMRCIKYHADEFGYSNEKIGVMGHSKSAISAITSNPHPELLSEHVIYSGYKQGDVYGDQPYLTYKDGTPISSAAACVYHSMGYGSITREKFLTPANVPTFIACGVKDNATPAPRDYWEQEFKDYSEAGIPFAAAYMPEVGHTYPPYLIDPIYGYNYYTAFCAFFDYNLKGSAPQIMYTGIEVDGKVNTSDKGLFIYFSAPITEWSLLKSVSVTENGVPVEGEWIANCGGMMWTFVSDELISSKQYTLTVNTSAADINGNSLKTGYEKAFTVK